MRLAAIQSVVNDVVSSVLGLLDPATTWPISDRPTRYTGVAVPRILANAGASSRELCFPFRVRTDSARQSTEVDWHLPRFCPPPRPQCGKSTYPQDSHPCVRSVLGVSHTLDGFRLSTPGGLISSRTPRTRFALQGLSSETQLC